VDSSTIQDANLNQSCASPSFPQLTPNARGSSKLLIHQKLHIRHPLLQLYTNLTDTTRNIEKCWTHRDVKAAPKKFIDTIGMRVLNTGFAQTICAAKSSSRPSVCFIG